MRKSIKLAKPVAWTCGHIALIQLNKKLDFIAEQPFPTRLYAEAPWPESFSSYPQVIQIVYHRCQCGLRVLRGLHKGKFLKKPSSMIVSCPELGKPFTNLLCKSTNTKHEHLPGDGHPKELSQAQVWTWAEATKVMDGVAEVVARHRRGYTLYEEAFPIFPGADKIAQAFPLPEGMLQRPTIADEMAPKLHGKCMCPACRHRAGKTSWEHNRIRGEYHQVFWAVMPAIMV
jgi:hypothetical protein